MFINSKLAVVEPPPSGGSGESTGITNPTLSNLIGGGLAGEDFFGSLVRAAITLGFVVGAVIFVFMFIIGGIQWMSSGGDKASVETARGRISQALVGLVILFSLFVIIGLVETFFGVDIMTIDFASLAI